MKPTDYREMSREDNYLQTKYDAIKDNILESPEESPDGVDSINEDAEIIESPNPTVVGNYWIIHERVQEVRVKINNIIFHTIIKNVIVMLLIVCRLKEKWKM